MGQEEEAVKMTQQQQQQQQEEAKVEETKVEEPTKPSTSPSPSPSPSPPPPPPPPPPPLVLFVDLHCTGCAMKIEKSLMRIRGVEGVGIDMTKNEVSIKGIVDPQAVCAKITKKTKRVAKVLSPCPLLLLPSPHPHDQLRPQLLNSQVQVGGIILTVVELNVNMHCHACAQQLKKKILKMRGVQTASTELSTGKVVVTGTMDGNKLVEYVYRRTKKQARIVPQPQPQPQPDHQLEDQDPAAAVPPDQITTKADQEELGTTTDTNNNCSKELQVEEPPKPATSSSTEKEKEKEKEIMEMEAKAAEVVIIGSDQAEEDDHENMMKRMMYQYYQYNHPLFVMEPIPPPQLFSDDNPNACSIL